MKELITLTTLLLTFTVFSQAKKDLEEQITTLKNDVASLETKNAELQNNLNDAQNKQTLVLQERITQEKEIASLTHSLDSVNQRLNSGASPMTAYLIEFKNASAKFTVPKGKTWEIVNVFSNSVGPGGFSYDASGYVKYDEVRVLIKSINGSVLTDLSKLELGPVIYRGPNHERTQALPMIFPEGTTFELVICTGKWGDQESDFKANGDLGAYLNIVER
jgi:hypothetical protein